MDWRNRIELEKSVIPLSWGLFVWNAYEKKTKPSSFFRKPCFQQGAHIAISK